MSVNKVTLLGSLGTDPQVKEFENGGKVAQFSLATNERAFKTQDGREIPERTEWHNIVVRGKLADVAGQYLRKGSKVYLEGILRTRNYTDNQNQTRYITEIHVSTFEMLTPKQNNNQPTAQSQPAPTGQPAQQDDDDLPF